ncbi:MAG TPA: acyl-CoA dehydrogenase family protein [Solirubrobacteraceae bacterium]|nr:acyl-CoA dehydrogenase family protein [Solirubrobacteraceae bacterium]
MPIELTAHTAPGARLVSIAEELSELLGARAAEHDRNRTYPFEAIEELRAAGYFAAPVPVELGGLGVSSTHDLVVASSRLARGDASVAIGVNMHLVAVLNMVRRYQVALAAGAERRATGFASSLEEIARNGVALAAAISEPGQDLTRPATVATRTESGWRIDGRKMFCTMSPAATHLYVAVRYADDDDVERYAYAMVPTDATGVVVHDDWDALGMRASGSNSVSLNGVELPESGVRGGFRAGEALPYIERNLHAGLFHAAASLGIAEAADQVARRALAARIGSAAVIRNTHPKTKGTNHVPLPVSPTDGNEARRASPPPIGGTSPRPGVMNGALQTETSSVRTAVGRIAAFDRSDARARMQVADNAIDLAAARGVLSRAAALIDEHRAANPTSDGTADELTALFAEAQAAKAFTGEASTRIVDRALALSGGAGYLNASPLARAYRDVKAATFMQPLGADRAYDYLAHFALGEQSPLH